MLSFRFCPPLPSARRAGAVGRAACMEDGRLEVLIGAIRSGVRRSAPLAMVSCSGHRLAQCRWPPRAPARPVPTLPTLRARPADRRS